MDKPPLSNFPEPLPRRPDIAPDRPFTPPDRTAGLSDEIGAPSTVEFVRTRPSGATRTPVPPAAAAHSGPEEPGPIEKPTAASPDAGEPRETDQPADAPKAVAPLGALAAGETVDPADVPDELDDVKKPGETPAPEHTPNPTELELPEDIESLLSDALVPSGLPPGATKMLHVEGHPELLVRVNLERTSEDLRPDLPEIEESMANLAAHGVHVLPSQTIEQEGEIYTVTKRVDGVELPDALDQEPSPELLEGVDQSWKGLCDTLVDSFLDDRPFPNDVIQPFQYMAGTIDTDPDPKVWLVDLPTYTVRPTLGDEYAEGLLEVANAVRRLETQTGHNLIATRTAMEAALTLAPDSVRFGDGLIRAARVVLDEGAAIDRGDDEIIERLRTR